MRELTMSTRSDNIILSYARDRVNCNDEPEAVRYIEK